MVSDPGYISFSGPSLPLSSGTSNGRQLEEPQTGTTIPGSGFDCAGVKLLSYLGFKPL